MRNLDKILIAESITDCNNCPSCEETHIEEIISQVVSDDDTEEATIYACGLLKECKYCRAETVSDNNRM